MEKKKKIFKPEKSEDQRIHPTIDHKRLTTIVMIAGFIAIINKMY